jgi:hypothetical protein
VTSAPSGSRNWRESSDQFTHVRSFGNRAAVSAIYPKNLAVSVAAGLSIAQTGLSSGQEAATIPLYVPLAAATILGPLVGYLAMGQRATGIRERTEDDPRPLDLRPRPPSARARPAFRFFRDALHQLVDDYPHER